MVGGHGNDNESSSSYTHVDNNGNDNREEGFNVVSPMHMEANNTLRTPLDPSGAATHATLSAPVTAPKAPSVPPPSLLSHPTSASTSTHASTSVPVLAALPKPVLTHEIDENFDDDDDEIDAEDSTSGRSQTSYPPVTSPTTQVPSYAPPPIPTLNSEV